MARGVDAFHIYTLNRAELTEAICRALGRGSGGRESCRAAPPEGGAASEEAEDDRSEENESRADRDEVQRLDEGHRVASLCFTRRILTRK